MFDNLESFVPFLWNLYLLALICVFLFFVFLGLWAFRDQCIAPYFFNKKIAVTQRIQTAVMIIATIAFIVFGILFYRKPPMQCDGGTFNLSNSVIISKPASWNPFACNGDCGGNPASFDVGDLDAGSGGG